MKKIDVVIVGAGPGGLSCAKELGNSEINVLILEEKERAGLKICAGGMRDDDFKYFNIPTEFGGYRNKKQTYVTVDREELARHQLNIINNEKTDLMVGSKVTEIGESYVVVNNKDRISFKYLVGADGSCSVVRKHLKLKSEKAIFGMHYKVKSDQFKMMEYFYHEYFFPWYAWIFPNKNFVSVGCGYDPRLLPPRVLGERFSLWLKQNGIDVSNGQFEGFPIDCDFKGYRFGDIFLVGDAAGLASYRSGEGIHQALVSGEEVAKLIINKNHKPEKMEQMIHKKLKDDKDFYKECLERRVS